MNFRHEHKHYINYLDYLMIRSKLKAIMKPDANTNADGEYQIRSLYFDNYNDTALQEKINGINHREKFRIRCYNNNFSFINLEKKSKINGLCSKLKTPITREQTEAILSNKTAWMGKSESPLIVELYSKMKSGHLRPKTIVDYMREAYIYGPGNVRVTIDRDVRTGLFSTDMFNTNLPTVQTGVSQILLEVKYDNFLPEVISNIVQLDGRRQTAFSKYAVSRIFG
ncbi:polyphosphate polymerase domain-containing protein [Acetobacterium bakii]|uniref:Molecular chaperone n=1 Tax=Acetobacterium bakii TaxID=52689 RepID=A0A0L6U4R8_9FIRM|nr:polyphosphate polymerase domain-containing protein [Acetobacterium bakii]KNZ43511.1 molecular chaperone [Acetobacterium bakii]